MIEILNYEVAENKNKVVGYVDVKLTINKPTTIIFRKIARLNSNDKDWLNFPSFSKPNVDGTPQYYKYCEFTEQGHNSKFMEVVMDALKKYLSQNKEEVPF